MKMEEIKYNYPKAEKLKSRISIQELFEKGNAIQENNIKILYLPNNLKSHQIAFTVPKRSFKHATDRNTIKRQMREAYRLNKLEINNHLIKYNIIFIYLGKTHVDYSLIYKNIHIILCELNLKNLHYL
jgi:ribonuclease P protein component